MRARALLVLALAWMVHAAAPLPARAQSIAPPAAAGDTAQPGRRERELQAYDKADRAALPARGGIVFLGSSTIVDWDTARWFPDLAVVNRGLWGSSLADALAFVDRFVIAYEPRLVVLYAGDNDINAGRLAEEVAVTFEKFVAAVHARLPQTRIVFIGIKPSIQRWSQVDRMRAANAIIRAFCARDDRIAYVDVDGPMLGWDEKPRRELFADDGLHLSAQGYQLWTILLRPLLTLP